MPKTSSSSKGKKKRTDYKKTTFKKRSQISLFEEAEKVEWKNVDLQLADQALPNTNAWTTPVLLNGVDQGVGNAQRVGRSYTMKSLQYRFSTGNADGTGGSSGSAIRILIVLDRQANGAAPGVTDILNINNFQSTLNLSNNRRFLVISDKIHGNYNSNTTYGKDYKKLSLETVCSGTGATVASISRGSVYMLLSLATATSTGSFSYQFYNRIRYTDS